ncbi:apolipoprotein acyltransferase [Jannaschia sp. LMIT008]|uniref:apolipoprotein acyltransferase n=1 Tax=Jannaschia maritima TaxID=3032585 RepID=UPI002810A232|nr:apolipoprotein acyltransferase [Jannaschia sp. LMIT008]
MLPILTAIVGAVLGGLVARRRKGNGFDIAQWAAVWGIIGGLLGVVAIIVLTRF